MKVIYQTWKTRDLPPKFEKNRQKWLDMYPETDGWKHILLTDDDLRNLVKQAVPQHLQAYDDFTQNIERVDFARNVMMYLGGIYADLDTYPTKSIEPFLALNKIVLGREPLEHSRNYYNRELVICNAFMISPPKEDLWLKLMDYIVDNYEPYYKPVENTGPMAFTKFYESHKELFDKVLITDPCAFFPLTGKGQITTATPCDMSKDNYVVHEWSNTWVPTPFTDQMWFNKRYWCYALTGFIGIMIFFLLWRKKNLKK
jgi:mannosyltransferase OCH1-like enzyme